MICYSLIFIICFVCVCILYLYAYTCLDIMYVKPLKNSGLRCFLGVKLRNALWNFFYLQHSAVGLINP